MAHKPEIGWCCVSKIFPRSKLKRISHVVYCCRTVLTKCPFVLLLHSFNRSMFQRVHNFNQILIQL